MKSKRNDLHVVEEHKRSGFWFGFALGASAATSAIFLLGTKKGRQSLKRVIELSEGLEETVFDTLKELGLETLREVTENLKPKATRTFTALKDGLSSKSS